MRSLVLAALAVYAVAAEAQAQMRDIRVPTPVSVRAAASPTAPILARLEAGTIVTVMSSTRDWLLIRYAVGREGYISVSDVAIPTDRQDPCADSLYHVLKARQISEMSDREFEIFKSRDQACAAFQQTAQRSVQSSVLGVRDAQSYIGGTVDGRRQAELASVSSSVATGFLSGLLLGLVGTGIAYAAAGDDKPVPLELMPRAGPISLDYQLGFADAYTDRLRSRKQVAALGGGLGGTVVLAIVLLVVLN